MFPLRSAQDSLDTLGFKGFENYYTKCYCVILVYRYLKVGVNLFTPSCVDKRLKRFRVAGPAPHCMEVEGHIL